MNNPLWKSACSRRYVGRGDSGCARSQSVDRIDIQFRRRRHHQAGQREPGNGSLVIFCTSTGTWGYYLKRRL